MRIELLENGKKCKDIEFNGLFDLIMKLDFPTTKKAIKKRCKYKTEIVQMTANEYRELLLSIYNSLSIHRRHKKGLYTLMRCSKGDYFLVVGFLDSDITELPDWHDGYNAPGIQCE
jgi:hypothetical protein